MTLLLFIHLFATKNEKLSLTLHLQGAVNTGQTTDTITSLHSQKLPWLQTYKPDTSLLPFYL